MLAANKYVIIGVISQLFITQLINGDLGSLNATNVPPPPHTHITLEIEQM